MSKKIYISIGIILSLVVVGLVTSRSYFFLSEAEAQDAPLPQPAAEEEPAEEEPQPGDPVDPEEEVTDITPLEECTLKMRQYLPEKEKEFLTFIEEKFESEGPNSTKVNESVDKYMATRNEIWGTFLEYSGGRADDDLLQITARAPNCYILVENSYTALEDVLKKYATTTTASKTTSKLVEKYKEINGKLSGLNKSIGRMKGYIDAFESKLPCYIEKCIR